MAIVFKYQGITNSYSLNWKHKYNLANIARTIVNEYRCFTWMDSGIFSSAKRMDLDDAVFYYRFSTPETKKIPCKKQLIMGIQRLLLRIYHQKYYLTMKTTKQTKKKLINDPVTHIGYKIIHVSPDDIYQIWTQYHYYNGKLLRNRVRNDEAISLEYSICSKTSARSISWV